MKPVQLPIFVTLPKWLIFARSRPEFEEFKPEIPLGYWRLSMTDEVGVCVGHWHDPDEPGRWVLLLLEDGSLEAFGPYSLFPAKCPAWYLPADQGA